MPLADADTPTESHTSEPNNSVSDTSDAALPAGAQTFANAEPWKGRGRGGRRGYFSRHMCMAATLGVVHQDRAAEISCRSSSVPTKKTRSAHHQQRKSDLPAGRSMAKT